MTIGLEPLSLGELLGVIGDKEVELAQYRRALGQAHERIAELERELAAVRGDAPTVNGDG